MSNNENFLKAYRDFESAIKTSGYESVLAYENKLEEKEKKTGKKDENLSSIRLCRQCRNFLSHESKDFFEASKQMIDFLNGLSGEISNEYLPIKKFVVKQTIAEDTKVQEAASVLCKKKSSKNVPVFNKTGEVVGFISKELICAYLSKNNITSTVKVKSLMGTKVTKQMFKEIEDTTPMKDISEESTYIVRNAKGVTIGWY